VVIGAIWAVDLDDAAFDSVVLEIAIYRNESPLMGVGARRHNSVFSSIPYYRSGSLDRANESYNQASEWF
jgi:hypothetical protein